MKGPEISSSFTDGSSLLHLVERGATGLGAGAAEPWLKEDEGPTLGGTDAQLRSQLSTLRVEHQDLDAAVAALQAKSRPDMIQIARLKKKKLRLRDEITRLEDQLTPDIIA